ncbi:MAG: hypothetical protein GTO18_19580 [Anaerolineales bacterium]|nr:hypothetical protein [Anaerolineales bacterium]
MFRRLLSEMRSITLFAFLIVLLAVMTAGCTESMSTTAPAISTSTPNIIDVSPPPTSTEVAIPSEAEPLVNRAVADLAARLNVSEEKIDVVKVESVEWPDTSLGCPQPGIMYADVIIPGHNVVMIVNQDIYEYHEGSGQEIICGQGGQLIIAQSAEKVTTEGLPAVPTIMMEEIIIPPYSDELDKLINIAKQDLVRRLDISLEMIDVAQIEKAEWEDTSFGCGDPSLVRHPVSIPGFRIVLSYSEWNYIYHTDRNSGVIYCPKG